MRKGKRKWRRRVKRRRNNNTNGRISRTRSRRV
jgi:hypothetical protein